MPPFEDPSFPLIDDATRALAAHLERAISCLQRGDIEGARAAAAAAASTGAPAAQPQLCLEIVDDGAAFTIRGRTTSLLRRGRMKRILRALAQRAELAPNAALTRDELLEAGWPGERMTAQSGALRVYTEICRLRRCGLDGVLITRDDGYALIGVTIARVTSSRLQ